MRRALALAVLALAALPAGAGARVLVIGDSLEVGTGPYLQARVRGTAGLALDARVGRPSGEGVGVLRAKLSPADDVVVFDLGTNDVSPAGLGADLARAAATVGGRCLVVATIVRPRLGGPLTGAVESFAGAHANVQVVPWRERVAGSRGLIGGDGIHATAAGYALRARLVADAVQGCPSTTPPIPGLDVPAPQPSALPDPKLAPRPPASSPADVTPRPVARARPPARPEPGASGFHVRAFRRYAPLLGTLAVAALTGPSDDPDLTIVTR